MDIIKPLPEQTPCDFLKWFPSPRAVTTYFLAQLLVKSLLLMKPQLQVLIIWICSAAHKWYPWLASHLTNAAWRGAWACTGAQCDPMPTPGKPQKGVPHWGRAQGSSAGRWWRRADCPTLQFLSVLSFPRWATYRNIVLVFCKRHAQVTPETLLGSGQKESLWVTHSSRGRSYLGW